jgi:hypothetical protein
LANALRKIQWESNLQEVNGGLQPRVDGDGNPDYDPLSFRWAERLAHPSIRSPSHARQPRGHSMTRTGFAMLLASFLGMAVTGPVSAAHGPSDQGTYQTLPKPGSRVPLGKDHTFTFGFVKQPKLGNAIMRVEIFTLDGKPDRSFSLKGDADMPSMRGAHSSGPKPFALSAKGAYLLPVQLVMPGDWEIRFTFEKNGETVFRGAYLFDL